MQSSSAQHDSIEDFDQSLDELIFSEIKRRRERDFGSDSDASSATEFEEECEEESEEESVLDCDSLCAESEVSELRPFSCDSESDVAEQECLVTSKGGSEGKRLPSVIPWSSEGLDQCHVPVASSLLNLPGLICSEQPSSPLTASLFPEYFSGTIHFPLHNENCTFVLGSILP